MQRNSLIAIIMIVGVIMLGIVISFIDTESVPLVQNQMEATVLKKNKNSITVQDRNNAIYTMSITKNDLNPGDDVLLKYSGLLDENKDKQNIAVLEYVEVAEEVDANGIPLEFIDDGLFKQFYLQAYNKLKTLSLEEKIAQIFLVRYDENAKNYSLTNNFGGFVFYEKDFKDKTKDEVIKMINSLQESAKIPYLIATDEEGGKVVRVSSNKNLVDAPYLSSQDLYIAGGFAKIKEDTTDKSKLLYSLGINLNLAPSVDVTTDPTAYMYERSFGHDTNLTKEYAKTVIEASKKTGVSYTLKHFPGYGNNSDTHIGPAVDTRTIDIIKGDDLPPFAEGIKAGAEAILFSHNIVEGIDEDNPVSLSAAAHNLLRNTMDFTGITITDDLDMKALDSIDDKTMAAILSGNDMLIVTDYDSAIKEANKAVKDGLISEKTIDKLAFRVLAWKYYKGLILENTK